MIDQILSQQFGAEDAARVMPRRAANAHKWSVGGLLVVAGSPGYVGAPALAAMAAQRVGAGIVNLAVPRGLIGPIASIVPEAAFVPLPDGELGTGGTRLFESIGERAEKCAAFLIGPGLGDDKYALDLVRALLGLDRGAARHSLGFGGGQQDESAPVSSDQRSLLSYERTVVVDADGINVLAGIENWWTGVPEGRLLLTPHVGEMARLLGASTDDVLQAPDAAAVEASRRFRQVVLLKGSPSMLASGSTVYPAQSSPASLATAGSGDVLAGAIAGFLAQGLAPIDAANLAIHVGCAAAAVLEQEIGQLGVVASDLPRAMAVALASLARS